MRPIDADAMRQDWLENGQNEYVYDTNAVLDSIDAQPTIEAEPVRHGRWKSVGLSSLKCSRCGYIDDYKMHYKGCPECRAKMDGGANE